LQLATPRTKRRRNQSFTGTILALVAASVDEVLGEPS
jgi:hypothetical protein